MGTDFSIRAATGDDARAIEEIHVAGMARRLQGEGTRWLGNNVRTRRFYEIAGWRPDGTVKTEDWNGFPLREVTYRTDLRQQPAAV